MVRMGIKVYVVVRIGIKVNVVVNCHGYQTGLASRM